MEDIIIRNEEEKQLIEDFRLLQKEDKERIISYTLFSSLSNDEREFLKKYRKLSARRKIEIQERLSLETQE